MKYSTLKQYMLWLALCIALSTGIASCGSSDTPTPEATVVPTTAPTVTPAPPTATVLVAVTATQTVSTTQTLTNSATITTPVAQPQSPLQAPKSPLQLPNSPLATPTKSASAAPAGIAVAPSATAGVMVKKILSDTATITDVTSSKTNGQIAVVSGIETISMIAKATKAEEPESGKASISGVLFASTAEHLSDRVIPDTRFYVAPAVVDATGVHPPIGYYGPHEEKGDVKGTSNLKGQIFLNNVPPGKYYLVVQKQPYDWYVGFESDKAPTPKLIALQAGQKLDLGLLYVRGQ